MCALGHVRDPTARAGPPWRLHVAWEVASAAGDVAHAVAVALERCGLTIGQFPPAACPALLLVSRHGEEGITVTLAIT